MKPPAPLPAPGSKVAKAPEGARRARRRAGYSLIQLMVVVTVSMAAIYFITTFLLNTQNAFSAGVTTETAQATAVKAANEIAAEIKDAMLSTLYVCSYCRNHISFQKNAGHDPVTGAVIPGSWVYYWYQWNYPGSYYSGVGEGSLIRWMDGQWGPVANFIKSTNPDTGMPGICITRNGNAITVAVTVEMKDRQERPVRYTATTTVTPLTQ